MFYEESKILDVLKCKNCNDTFDEPRQLPCGATICSGCAESIEFKEDKEYLCCICDQIHSCLSKTLPVNEIIYNLLLMQPDEVSRGKCFETLKTTLDIILNKINSIKLVLNNSSDKLSNYCADLVNEIQLIKEQHIQSVEDYAKTLIDKIEMYKEHYKTKFESTQNSFAKENLNEILLELETFHEDWTTYLSNSFVDDEFINEINETGKRLIEKADENEFNIDNVFKSNLFKFQKGEIKRLDLIIGKLEYELTTPTIVSYNQMIELFELCEFRFSNKWKLIYRASDDGFDANDFHFKCDFKQNTLIIIKTSNGNIFGGYTTQDWSGTGYKGDMYAFLFSYKNMNNKPIKMKCSDPAFAISCHKQTGPCFGAGHDLFIASDSNKNHSSYSNLCHSYKHPEFAYNSFEAKTFLAESYNFVITEIEVYSKELN